MKRVRIGPFNELAVWENDTQRWTHYAPSGEYFIPEEYTPDEVGTWPEYELKGEFDR